MKNLLLLAVLLLVGLTGGLGRAAMMIKLGMVTKLGSAQNITAEQFKSWRSNGRTRRSPLLRAYFDRQKPIFYSKSRLIFLQQIQVDIVMIRIIPSGLFGIFDFIVLVVDCLFLFKDNQQFDTIPNGPIGWDVLASSEISGFKELCFPKMASAT